MDRDRYYVIPAKYIELLTREQKKQFSEVLGVVTTIREVLGKELDPGYYVCKHDEPYAQSVRDMIEEGEEAKENIDTVGTLEDLIEWGIFGEGGIEDAMAVMDSFADEDDACYEAMQSNFDEAKFDKDVFSRARQWSSIKDLADLVIEEQNEALANESAKAKREEIQRHVEHMENLNNIGKKDGQ